MPLTDIQSTAPTPSASIDQPNDYGIGSAQLTSPSWLNRLDEKTLVFYAKPLLAKWLKAFPNPDITFVSDAPLPDAEWKRVFKTDKIRHLTPEAARREAHDHPDSVTLLVYVHESMTDKEIIAPLPLLRKGGAVITVSRNMNAVWDHLSMTLDHHQIFPVYPVGFHPKGAVAWWPFFVGPLVWVGSIMEMIVSFFPGRYELALRYGHCWMIRGFKRDDQTLFIES